MATDTDSAGPNNAFQNSLLMIQFNLFNTIGTVFIYFWPPNLNCTMIRQDCCFFAVILSSSRLSFKSFTVFSEGATRVKNVNLQE